MSPASIRPATPDDIAAITRIYAHAVTHGTASFEIDPPSAAEMARRQRALADGGYPFLVAELDGNVAGYAYAGPYRHRPAYHWSVEDSVYV
ncbi:MAG: N-acetyltransferase family protein, partial [Pseudomonadota bacterium]|nr:N-acetyltransferase family protein [Pseudomonadota bacterium]